jgi:hypothetical protein
MMTTSLLVLSLLAAEPAEVTPPRHQLSLSLHSGAMAYLSRVRTQGGVGGGVGVRDTVDGRWLLQADVSGLTGLGSVLALRLGAGVQRQGFWTPAALVTVTGLFGDRLDFLTPQQPLTGAMPALSLGVTLAPARFTVGQAHVSLLELGVGVGTEGAGQGILYGLTLLEVGVAL